MNERIRQLIEEQLNKPSTTINTRKLHEDVSSAIACNKLREELKDLVTKVNLHIAEQRDFNEKIEEAIAVILHEINGE